MGDLDVLLVGRAGTPTQPALVEAARRQALRIEVVDPRRLIVVVGEDGCGALVEEVPVTEMMAPGGVILIRSGNRILPFLGTWLGLAEKSGLRLVNSLAACALSVDKLATAVALCEAGVEVVPTWASLGQAPPQGLAEPFVLKPAFGFHGIGVQLATRASVAARERAVSSEWGLFGHEIAQPRVGLDGQDHRVVVIGGRAAAAATRKAQDGSLTTNGANSTWEACSEASILDAAVRAADALGLDYAGVDVIDHKGRPHVLEVNGWPGLVLTAAATGVDLPGQVLEHVRSRVGRNR